VKPISQDVPAAGAQPNLLSESIYAAIGHIAVQWSYLEEACALALMALTGASFNEMSCISANMNSASRFNALLALADRLPEPERSELRAIVTAGKDLGGERNRIIHSAWRSTDSPDVAVRLTYRATGKLVQKREPKAVSELEGVGNAIGQAKDQLIKFMESRNMLPGATPQPVPEP